jgi:hypothetical protein
VTAPDLHRVVTEALFAHDWPDEDLAADCGAYSDDYRDAARAVLAALAEAGTVEWGTETVHENDGRVLDRDVWQTEKAAREVNRKYGDRVVSRLTLPWTAVE